MQHELVRQTINIAVSKALKDMQTNTKRTIRNMIDLGLLFSRSDTQKWFFNAAKQVITTPENPYNSLISRMVSDIDHETIKTFSINLGYSSLIYGANKLKNMQNAMNLKLPWFLLFDMSSDTGFGDIIFEIPRWIYQGRELGIYSFGFSSCSEKNLPLLCEIIKQFKGCAFILETKPGLITSQNAAYFNEIHNAVIVVDIGDLELNSSECTNAFIHLRQNHCLYGCSSKCSDSNFDLVTSPQNITKTIEQGNTFYIFRSGTQLSSVNKELLYKFVCRERSSRGQPLICFDWFKDTAFISEKLLSKGGCMTLPSARQASYKLQNKNTFTGTSLLEIIRM